MAQLVKNPTAVQKTWVQSWVGKIPWRRERLPTLVFWPGEFHGQSMGSQSQIGLCVYSLLFTHNKGEITDKLPSEKEETQGVIQLQGHD